MKYARLVRGGKFFRLADLLVYGAAVLLIGALFLAAALIGGGQVYVLLFDVRYKPGAHQAQGLDYLKIQFDNLPLPL